MNLLTGSYADVIVNGTSCTLDGATVNGSVLVSSGGTLIANNDTNVFGSVQVDAGGDIDLDNVTVLGDVTLKDSNDVTVGTNATIGTLKVEKSGEVNANGAIGSIESKESGRIRLAGATKCRPSGAGGPSGTRRRRLPAWRRWCVCSCGATG